MPVDRLRAHPRNIRSDLGDLRELAESIRHEGVLVPLMAEDGRGTCLQLLHGHRRWAAAQLAGVRRVPVVIVDPHDTDEAILVMLAEDKKRAVSPEDRGRAVVQLRTEFGYTWEGVAARLGVSVGTVRNWADRHAGPGVTTRRAKARQRPRIRPTQVHDLISQVDAGELDAAAAVDAMRRWLGDWRPAEGRPVLAGGGR
ncbi:MAG: ParB/RepB/Spo0J family partition protein [Pseudonocardia sp.]|nr:ParB/RepB/Spo0J family partition protein [Pseudonocardia sp.]